MHKEINYIQEFDSLFTKYFSGLSVAEDFKTKSLQIFYGKLKNDAIANYLEIAYNKFPDDPDTCLKYFCGICWNKIRTKNGTLNSTVIELASAWKKISFISNEDLLDWSSSYSKETIISIMEDYIKQMTTKLFVLRYRNKRED